MTTQAICKILTEDLGKPELTREARRRITGRNSRLAPIERALERAFARVQVAAEAKLQASQRDPLADQPYDVQAAFDDDVRRAAEELQSALAGISP